MIDWKKRKQDLSARIYNIPFANYYDLLDGEQRYVLDEIIAQEQSMIEKLEADKYKANFLWPYEEDSIEALGYEFANVRTEEYQKECWKGITDNIIKLEADKAELLEALKAIEEAVNDNCIPDAQMMIKNIINQVSGEQI